MQPGLRTTALGVHFGDYSPSKCLELQSTSRVISPLHITLPSAFHITHKTDVLVLSSVSFKIFPYLPLGPHFLLLCCFNSLFSHTVLHTVARTFPTLSWIKVFPLSVFIRNAPVTVIYSYCCVRNHPNTW